jgi:hypothetical protein
MCDGGAEKDRTSVRRFVFPMLDHGFVQDRPVQDLISLAHVVVSLAGDTFTGTVTAPNFVSSSDVRLKSDIETIGEALDILQHLRGVRYTSEGRRQIVAYGNITGLLIEAIKDLSARIIQLETQSSNVQP